MQTGTIKFFNVAKGFGFVTDEKGTDIFVHVSGLIDQQVNEGDRVNFDTQEGKKGLNAVNVKKA